MLFINTNTGVREEVGSCYPTSMHTVAPVKEITNNKAARVYRALVEEGGYDKWLPLVKEAMHS